MVVKYKKLNLQYGGSMRTGHTERTGHTGKPNKISSLGRQKSTKPSVKSVSWYNAAGKSLSKTKKKVKYSTGFGAKALLYRPVVGTLKSIYKSPLGLIKSGYHGIRALRKTGAYRLQARNHSTKKKELNKATNEHNNIKLQINTLKQQMENNKKNSGSGIEYEGPKKRLTELQSKLVLAADKIKQKETASKNSEIKTKIAKGYAQAAREKLYKAVAQTAVVGTIYKEIKQDRKTLDHNINTKVEGKSEYNSRPAGYTKSVGNDFRRYGQRINKTLKKYSALRQIGKFTSKIRRTFSNDYKLKRQDRLMLEKYTPENLKNANRILQDAKNARLKDPSAENYAKLDKTQKEHDYFIKDYNKIVNAGKSLIVADESFHNKSPEFIKHVLNEKQRLRNKELAILDSTPEAQKDLKFRDKQQKLNKDLAKIQIQESYIDTVINKNKRIENSSESEKLLQAIKSQNPNNKRISILNKKISNQKLLQTLRLSTPNSSEIPILIRNIKDANNKLSTAKFGIKALPLDSPEQVAQANQALFDARAKQKAYNKRFGTYMDVSQNNES